MEYEVSKVKSLGKALTLLECFTIQEPELGVTQLAERMRINKSNVYSILNTFQQGGYIEKLPNGRYTLGLKLLEFSYVINQHLGYPRAVYDLLMDLANRTNEIVYFGLPHGREVLYLYVARPAERMRELPYRDVLGQHAPLYCTSVGKAILAAMPEEDWTERLPETFRSYTPNTLTDREAVLRELRKTRERGYAVDDCEWEERIRCVGMPVYNSAGQLVAGISTSGPAGLMTEERVLHCARLLAETARQMRGRIYR